MAIVVTPISTTFGGYAILATSNQSLEISNPFNRNIPFNMIIDSPIAVANYTNPLALSDVTGYTTRYPLVDRLNKQITGIELYRYAGKRRCIQCVYNPVFKVIRVCSCIDPINLTLPTTSTTTGETNANQDTEG